MSFANQFIKKHEDGTYTVNSGLPEFGYELLSALPYAYYLYEKGLLRKTVSGIDTKSLYWFSPDHEELEDKRDWDNMKMLQKSSFPNISIHKNQLSWDIFSPPPLKEYYLNKAIKFEKPTVVICNRINVEWGGEPINFIDSDTLETIVKELSSDYELIYIDPSSFGRKYEDHVGFHEYSVDEVLAKYNITTFSDLVRKYEGVSVNELQCRLYAGSEKFISSNGGLGILCSYFGGENIIFSKICREVDKDVNSFYSWYPRLSGAVIKVVRDEMDLVETIRSKWVRKDPLFNVLIRTSRRPNYFHDCIRSIINQSYKNVNIIVGYDDDNSMNYIQGHPCLAIKYERNESSPPTKPEGSEYGVWFPYNEYFNYLLPYANNGYVVYLDDDDCFVSKDSLSTLAKTVTDSEAQAIFWRVVFPKRIVPSDENWEKKYPVCRDMSTIGYCHSVEIKPHWEPWKRGDYRVAKYIFDNSDNTIWLNEKLTGLQRSKQDGYGLRDDKNNIITDSDSPVVVVITAYNAAEYLERCIDSVVLGNYVNGIRIIVGIDACSETFKVAKPLTRKYGSKVDFYYAKENGGTYVLKNSLLKKVVDRSSLIFFLDADDLIPPGFIKTYRDIYLKSKVELLRINSVNLNESLIADSFRMYKKGSTIDYESLNKDLSGGDSESALVKLLCLFMKEGGVNISSLFLSVLKYYTLKDRVMVKEKKIKPVTRRPHGSFFCSFNVLESLGFFNEFRVAQDTDFMQRVRANGGKSISVTNDTVWLIRSVNDSSLTCSSETGIGSPERSRIVNENKRRIREGKIVVDTVLKKLTQVI